ncbi:WXG100 family type VII secretion target [Prauserella rugosa]|uniref:WXG100 family type VII secretion target n=1 Tax=Prauserella rugosa TaxID=43354 RepID=UPI001FE54974|nr:hypothetical protein [Prauserella rugosa]
MTTGVDVDGPGYHVDVDTLDQAGTAIQKAVDAQDNFELRSLTGEPEMYGDEPLRNALMDVCVRWSDRIDDLVDDADEIGRALKASAQAYREAERQAKGALPDDPAVDVADG